jgi:hypothetical protein
VDDCTVYYADLRLDGCDNRPIRIALACYREIATPTKLNAAVHAVDRESSVWMLVLLKDYLSSCRELVMEQIRRLSRRIAIARPL